MGQKWDEGRKERLTRMWNEGATSGEISRAFGDVSRNAVMGMVNRLGLMKSEAHASRMKAPAHGCCAPGWTRGAVPEADAAAPTHALEADAVIGTAQMEIAAPSAPETDFPKPVATVDASPAPVEPMPAAEEAPGEAEERDAGVGPTAAEDAASLPSVEEDARPEYAAIDGVPSVDVPVEGSVEPAVAAAPEEPAVAVATEEPAASASDEASLDTPVEAEAVGEARSAPSADAARPIIVPDAPEPRVRRSRAAAETPDEAAVGEGAPVDRLAMIRAAARKRQGVPSSRPWTPSRMPPNPRMAAPPPEVVISSGVISGIATSEAAVPDWREAFSLLQRLTGVSYDERVPGHVPALVAIATVMSKGDPRRVLVPRIPEQSILRMMRRFAERGAVVAGKPPERWTSDVDDRAFYREMVEIGAA